MSQKHLLWKGGKGAANCRWLHQVQALGMMVIVSTLLWGVTPQRVVWGVAQADHAVYLPLVFKGNGSGLDPSLFQIAFVDDQGAWLIASDGSRKLLLTTDIQREDAADRLALHAAPGGGYVAVQRTDGWSVYADNRQMVADNFGAGFSLAWGRDAESVLLAKLGHGIDRFTLADRQLTPLLETSDETNDHSPLWSADGNILAFAHQEFGTQLYVTLIPNFDEAQLPYMGENRDSGLLNEQLVVVDHVESWHDQPITFHWANDQSAIIFAAKTTIHVRSLVDENHTTIQPPGFGIRETGRSVDVYDDRILYFADDGIYVVGLDGVNPQRVIEGDDLHYPQWDPKGGRIVYRGTDDQLYRVNVDGSDNQVIPNTMSVNQFVLLQ